MSGGKLGSRSVAPKFRANYFARNTGGRIEAGVHSWVIWLSAVKKNLAALPNASQCILSSRGCSAPRNVGGRRNTAAVAFPIFTLGQPCPPHPRHARATPSAAHPTRFERVTFAFRALLLAEPAPAGPLPLPGRSAK